VSLETLLLLAVFVLLPLIQRLLEAARRRDPRPPGRPGRRPVRTPPAPTQALPKVPVRPLPDMAPDRTSGATTPHGPSSARDTAALVTLVLPHHRSARRRTAVVDVRKRLDLRRAIVLTAILGPCRAVNPYAWSEGARRSTSD
jgi:hypothetical protein